MGPFTREEIVYNGPAYSQNTFKVDGRKVVYQVDIQHCIVIELASIESDNLASLLLFELQLTLKHEGKRCLSLFQNSSLVVSQFVVSLGIEAELP